MTPAQRSAAARVAANTRWAHEPDRSAAGRRGQAGLRRKFEREIDPNGVMPTAELTKRVDNLIRAHMGRLSARGKKARQGAAA